MSYWKSKVAPKLKKLFDNKGGKKKGATNASKLFDSSKESLEKEIGEKQADLSPKIIELYRSSTDVSKKLLKEPSESAVKENPDAAQALLQELTAAGFPGAATLSDASKKYGPPLLTGPIVYLFGKTSTFLVDEPLPEPTQQTREITIQPSADDEAKEPEGEVVAPPHPAPASHVEEESGSPSEEKKEVAPFLEAKKDELVAVVEDTKRDVKEGKLNPLEPKKEEAVPSTEAKEAKKEETDPPTEAQKEEEGTEPEGKKEKASALVEGKKEEAKSTIEGKKEEAKSGVEGKKEDIKSKKEEVKSTLEDKKEEVKGTLEGKKEEVKSVLGTDDKKDKPN